MTVGVAFITGINGQDGSYLSEYLLEKGYEVHGLIRPSSNPNTQRIDHLIQQSKDSKMSFKLHYGDLLDSVGISNLIRTINPSEVYNLAAQSHVLTSFKMPQYTAQINAVSAVALLEAIKSTNPKIRYYQASTSEIFGSTPPPQNEVSIFQPRSPYAAAKLMAYWTTVNYRDSYGLHATNGILFNHESPRRGENFVTRKITLAAAAIKCGLQDKLILGNLRAIRDWGYAKEYVKSMWLMLQQSEPNDFVIATGIGASVSDFAEEAFSYLGLNWKDYVSVNPEYERPSEVDAIVGDATKAKKLLGWRPQTSWQELARLMVDSDMELIRRRLG